MTNATPGEVATSTFRPSPLKLSVLGFAPGVLAMWLVSYPFGVRLAIAALIVVATMLPARWLYSVSIDHGELRGPSANPAKLRSRVGLSELTLGFGPDSVSPTNTIASTRTQEVINVNFLSKRNRERLVATIGELQQRDLGQRPHTPDPTAGSAEVFNR